LYECVRVGLGYWLDVVLMLPAKDNNGHPSTRYAAQDRIERTTQVDGMPPVRFIPLRPLSSLNEACQLETAPKDSHKSFGAVKLTGKLVPRKP
jgi:hypothetical protein